MAGLDQSPPLQGWAKGFQASHLRRSEQSEVFMLRYFFHFHSGLVVTPDLEWTEFSSLEAAIAEAQRARTEIMADGGHSL